MDTFYGLCFNRPKDNLCLKLPDGSSNGPILPTVDCNMGLNIVKDIRKKMPYTNSTFTIPIYYNQLTHSSVKSNDYSNYHRGQIKLFSIADHNYISYIKPTMCYTKPSGGSLSDFSTSQICQVGDKFTLEKATRYSNVKRYTGLDVSVYGNEALSVLLTEDEFDIVEVPSSKTLIKSKSQRKLTDASLHKTLKGYFTVMEREGRIHVFNCARKTPCWSRDLASNFYHTCQFAYHPQSVFAICDENIICLDTRIFSSGNRLVFSLSNIGSSFEQRICSTAFHQNPYVYVNCTNTVYLIDERYVKSPVTLWNHLLPCEPNFSDLLCINSENILILGNSSDRQVCLISTKAHELDSIKPYVPQTGLPYHFYPTEDTLANANQDNIWYHSAVRERFSSQWVGFAANAIKNNNFNLWTQNVCGDLMYQTYNPTEPEQNNIRIQFTEESKKRLQQYENSILKNLKSQKCSHYCKIANPSTFFYTKRQYSNTHCIKTCKESQHTFWKTEETLELKKTNLKFCNIPLINAYNPQEIESPNQFIENFLSYRKECVNSLDRSLSNNLKNNLACIWDHNIPADDPNSDECTTLYDSNFITEGLIPLEEDFEIPLSIKRSPRLPTNDDVISSNIPLEETNSVDLPTKKTINRKVNSNYNQLNIIKESKPYLEGIKFKEMVIEPLIQSRKLTNEKNTDDNCHPVSNNQDEKLDIGKIEIDEMEIEKFTPTPKGRRRKGF